MTGDTLARLLVALRNPTAYPHDVDDVVAIETHISHVLLAGAHAYKLKKPLDLGLLDYATLAPGLYESVVAITGSADAPRLHDDPPPAGETALEYAVRMKRFPQSAQLDRRLADGALDVADMRRIAACVSDYQGAAPRVHAEGPFGTAECAYRPVNENFVQIVPRVSEAGVIARLESLHAWAAAEHARLTPFLEERRARGFVRACHGDLHLSNLAEIDGRIVAFDCIEFDPNLYWIDVVSDTAFLVMDLLARGRRDLAATFLDDWLQRTGDFDGLRLLRLHLVYRSMVRAKVAAIALSQHPGETGRPHRAKFERHLDLAKRIAESSGGGLIILCGLSGSGKSTLSRALVRDHAALSVHTDVERKRLFGLGATETSNSPIDGGIYTADANRRTYDALEHAVRGIIVSGHVAVADGCFLRRSERDHFRSVAKDLGVPSVVVLLDAPDDELRRRVSARQAAGGDPSEAGPEVVRRQLRTFERPGDSDEEHATFHVGDVSGEAAADAYRRYAAEAHATLFDPPV